ncbi:MAG: LPS O-antigen length regulator [Idiomarina sp.]|nr:LPS O-antigen length regulator [Idiomarina sp.]
MTERQYTADHRKDYEDDLDLVELVKALWSGKWIIIAVTFVFAVGSIAYALSQPNMYRSEALLAPAEDSGGMRVPGQLGGLAALAGVNLGGSGGGTKVALALEILKSRDFLGRFIEKHDLKVPIMAAKSWDIESNTLVIDPDIYDEATGTWVREVKLPLRPEPSLLETHEEFLTMLSVSEGQNSGMVRVAVEHYSPYLAAEWVRLLVHEVNEEMRKRELEEATNSIAYLEAQLERTSLADVQLMLYSLIEEQTKTLMLANVRPEYVLITIDPAIVPEKRSKPSRAMIVIIGTFIGGLLSATFVIMLSMFRRRTAKQ